MKFSQLIYTLSGNTNIKVYEGDNLIMKGKLKSMEIDKEYLSHSVKHISITEKCVMEIFL